MCFAGGGSNGLAVLMSKSTFWCSLALTACVVNAVRTHFAAAAAAAAGLGEETTYSVELNQSSACLCNIHRHQASSTSSRRSGAGYSSGSRSRSSSHCAALMPPTLFPPLCSLMLQNCS